MHDLRGECEDVIVYDENYMRWTSSGGQLIIVCANNDIDTRHGEEEIISEYPTYNE